MSAPIDATSAEIQAAGVWADLLSRIDACRRCQRVRGTCDRHREAMDRLREKVETSR